MANKSVTASLTAQNTFSNGISPTYKGESFLNISISGTFVAIVTLQRSFDGGSNWVDVDSFSSPIETRLWEYEEDVLYRLGVKTGNYTSGTVAVRLSR